MYRVAKDQNRSIILRGKEGTSNITVDSGGKLDLLLLFLDLDHSVSSINLQLAKAAHACITLIIVGTHRAEINLRANLDDNASLFVNKLSLQKNTDLLKITYKATQSGLNSRSNYSGVNCLSGSSRQECNLGVDFMRGAKGSSGKEHEKVLLLSKNANCLAIPQIACNEANIDGAHGLSIGKIFGDETRYLRSRGLSTAKIRKMYVSSELQKIIKLVHDPEAKKAIKRAARAW